MKEWLKPLPGRYNMALFAYVSLSNDKFCFKLPFKHINPAPFLDSITHLKVQLFESYASWFAEELIEKHDHYQEKSPKI